MTTGAKLAMEVPMKKLYNLLLLAALSGMVNAKVASDGQKAFTLNAPDNWKYTTQVNPRGIKENGWKNAKNSGALVLTSVHVGETSLDDWAKAAARQDPKTIVSSETLGGAPAKRLDFTTSDGYITTIWLTTKSKKGAMISLVRTKDCPDDIPAISKAIVSSFHWAK